MQSSKDIKLKSYGTDGLLIRQMSYIKNLSVGMRESYKKYCMFF